MRRPVVRRDLVLDQVVHRLGVGHAQQRLGKAHQRHALLGREAVGGEEDLHQPRIGRGAHIAHQPGRAGGDRLDRCSADRSARRNQPGERLVFVGQDVGTHEVTKVVERWPGMAIL